MSLTIIERPTAQSILEWYRANSTVKRIDNEGKTTIIDETGVHEARMVEELFDTLLEHCKTFREWKVRDGICNEIGYIAIYDENETRDD